MKKVKKDKRYRLTGDKSPINFVLKTGKNGNLLVFDEEAGYQRAIRHCPNDRKIFVDEQSKHALTVPIIFNNGYLEVKSTQVVTQEFLDMHPDNGRVFEEVDFEKEAQEDLAYEDMVVELKTAVMQKQKEEQGIYELEALVAVLKNSIVTASAMTPSELRRTLYQEIDINPNRFYDEKGEVDLFDSRTYRKHVVLKSMSDNIIKINPSTKAFQWSHNNQLIVNVPKGLDPKDYLSEYLETDEGILLSEEIQKRY